MKTLYIFYAFTSAPPLPKDNLAGQEDGLSTSVILAEDLQDATYLCRKEPNGFNPEAYIEIPIQDIKDLLTKTEGTLVWGAKIATNDQIKET